MAVRVVTQKTLMISWEGSLKRCGSKHKSPKLVNPLTHHIIHALAFTQHWHRPQYNIYYSKSINFHALHYGSSELTLQTMHVCMPTHLYTSTEFDDDGIIGVIQHPAHGDITAQLLAVHWYLRSQLFHIQPSAHWREKRKSNRLSAGIFFAPQLCCLVVDGSGDY